MNASKLVTIELPEEKTSIKLNINVDTTVGQVADIIRARPFYKNETDPYSIALKADPSIVFSNDNKISKVPMGGEFIFRKVLFYVNVKNGETNQIVSFGLDPLLSVKEAINFIEHCKFRATQYNIQTRAPENVTPNHDMFLVTNSNSSNAQGGVKMDYNRTLASYRLKSEDILLLSSIKTQSKVWQDMAGGAEIPVIITSPEHNLTKAFKYPLDVTFEHIVEKFLEKANIKDVKWFYGIYLNVGGEVQEMAPDWTLATFPLPTPARLEFRKRTRPAINWFGADPETLPQIRDPDNGLMVPEILVILKDMLISQDGIETEGVFRKAGLESEMIVLKEKINAGEYFFSDNCHSIATLLKRWYKELPVRILSQVDKDLSDNEIIHLENYLPAPLMKLFDWLISLLLLVVAKQELNLMDPKNCAIVWGPGMIGSSEAANSTIAAFDDFQDTRFGINVIEANISHLRNNNLKPYSVANLPPAPVVCKPKPEFNAAPSSVTPAKVTSADSLPRTPPARAFRNSISLGISFDELMAKRQKMGSSVEDIAILKESSTSSPSLSNSNSAPSGPPLPPKPVIPPKPDSALLSSGTPPALPPKPALSKTMAIPLPKPSPPVRPPRPKSTGFSSSEIVTGPPTPPQRPARPSRA